MSPRNEDFLFAQEAQRRGFVTEVQVEEGFLLQRRMMEELHLDERLAVILVKRGWLAEEQARRVFQRIEPRGEQDEIAGYTILEKIGGGAMGTVYKAMHANLERLVAIKILRRELARDATQVERLKEEARILASLDHPNIVRALDAGESGGFPFVVMEYVEGESLKERISRRGPMRERDALKITRAIADALERARRMGVVHRDVKPGNIILSRAGEPKLMDLGLAKGPVDLGLTQHGATVGTPQFISPEQAQDPKRADTRSDIYSLGATLYAMLTGRPPHQGQTLAEVLTKVLYREPTPLRGLNKDVSPETQYVVERMMLKDPGLRHQTPAAVVSDVDGILAGRPIIPSDFKGDWDAFLHRKRVKRWTRIGAGALAVLLLAGFGIAALVDQKARKKEREEGRVAVLEMLQDADLDRDDDFETLRGKLSRARLVLDRYEDVAPEGIRDLEVRAARLAREVAYVETFESEVAPETRADIAKGSYASALQRVTAFRKKIRDNTSPIIDRVATLDGDVKIASRAEVVRLQSDARGAVDTSLDGAVDRIVAHDDALAGPFVDDKELQAARSDARKVKKALLELQGLVAKLKASFAAAPLHERLLAMDYQGIVRDLELQRRGVVEAQAEGVGRLLESAGLGQARLLRILVNARVEEIDDQFGRTMDQCWKDVGDQVDARLAKGDSAGAIELLERFEKATGAAGFEKIRLQAAEKRWEVEVASKEERIEARGERDALLAEALGMVRAGRPDAVRRRVAEVLGGKEPHWPYRRDLEALLPIADALERVHHAALERVDRARGSRLEDVRLRDGRTERRWHILEVDPDAATMTVSTTGRGPKRLRRMTELAPDQVIEWATPDGGALPPLDRATAVLMTVPDGEPADLRPLGSALAEGQEAFRLAGVESGFAGWVGRFFEDVNRRQARRESSARSEIDAYTLYFAQAEYEKAFPHLRRLLREEGELRWTHAVESKLSAIRQDLEAVKAQLAHLGLSEHFPGALVQVNGDRTTILIDFESPTQLDVFREGVGRACGAIEQYSDPRVVSPDEANYRFHLLPGIDSLVRDCPLVLPSIFDPAESITVSFDLFTLDSPFLLAIDVDGLQAAILSADPTSPAYRGRWRLPPDGPRTKDEKKAPTVDWYGRGRGVAFHGGKSFGDITAWPWPAAGRARNYESWEKPGKELPGELFRFQPQERYRVRIVRKRGRITLFVDDRQILSEESAAWATLGAASDRDRYVRGGTGLIQILTWTPQAIDNLRLQGKVLKRWKETS